MSKSLEAQAISIKGKYFLLMDDTRLEWSSMLDKTGADTEDPTQCVIALVKIPEGYANAGKWTGVDIREFGADQLIGAQ